MKVFHDENELKKYLLIQSEIVVKKAQEKIAMVINHFLTQYYKEFSPDVYVRTSQLLNSLTKTNIKSISNGWIAEIYFDLSALDYSTRIVPDRFAGANPFNTYHRENWTKENDAWVLENAMMGTYPHGGYSGATGNTQIWIESMNVLTIEKRNILKKALEDAGIPVR